MVDTVSKDMGLFVYSKIIPTTLNSRVPKKRAILTYAILKGITIDVGKIVNVEIHTLVNLRAKIESKGFSYLIHALCRQPNVEESGDSLNIFPPNQFLRLLPSLHRKLNK